MLACLDVAYDDTRAHAGCLVFHDWGDSRAHAEHVSTTPLAAPYVPGAFFERELPPMLDVLSRVKEPLEAIVVDGYVWLSGKGKGLGAHLFEALGERVPIVGVAKNEWTRPALPGEDRAHRCIPIVRGASTRPLFVTSTGVDVEVAAARIASMHGPHRLPTLLKAVDALVRAAAARVTTRP
ncbi:MAG: endonuclease V [Deltaproteobacteria bacterium]|nr:endonuclease V [Deltaproteobacteria bacterium]